MLSRASASCSSDLMSTCIYTYTARTQLSGLVSTAFAPPQRLAYDSCAEISPVRSFCPILLCASHTECLACVYSRPEQGRLV